MISGKNFIGTALSAEGSAVVHSHAAKDGAALPGDFYPATPNEMNAALAKATTAAPDYAGLAPEHRAEFLEAIAAEIEALGDTLIQRASLESGLPEGRFVGERGRTVGQLRLFAKTLRAGRWQQVTITTAQPDRKPMPRVDIRKMLTAVGPVAVFTASNFPLAFSTAGGDTASALAAGCPVIVKAHELHLGTNDLVAGAIVRAAHKTGMPEGVFSSLNGQGHETGKALVLHPEVKGVAFTGSLGGGKALYDLAAGRPDPIPVFAEMGSINPVVFLPEVLAKNGAHLAEQYAGSMTMGVGQFCTNPGLLLGVKSEALEAFAGHLAEALNGKPSHTMLSAGIAANFASKKAAALAEQGVTLRTQNSAGGAPTLATCAGARFLERPTLHHEVFGPFSLLVECDSEAELLQVIGALEGQLTGTLMGTDADLQSSGAVIQALQARVGRLIFNNVPTGVEVCEAMHHGGPYPATTDTRYTSVGTDAIHRFLRPICYQNMPAALLPDALKDDNPQGLWRLVDGELQAP